MMSIYMKIWDIDTLTCLKRIENQDGLKVDSFQELSDGTILQLTKDIFAHGQRPLISIWDLERGTCVSRFELGEEYGALNCKCEILQLRSGNELLLWCSEWQSSIFTMEVMTFRLSTEERCRLVGHSAAVGCVLQLQDGRLVSGSHDRTVKVWDIPFGRCLVTLDHPSGLQCLAPPLQLHGPSSQRIVSACEDGSLLILDTTTYSC
jgi:WD40 repeat protein